MFSPYKPVPMRFADKVHLHNMAKAIPPFMGSYKVTPTDPFAFLIKAQPLAGSRLIVRDQLMSGFNAVMWRDPSGIL